MDNGAYGNLGSPKSMASRRSATSYQSNDDHNSRLHKQLLAAEITKLRKELEILRAQQARPQGSAGISAALKQARMDKERIEAEKAEVVAQASSQKQVLVSEVSMLRNEIIQASRAPPSASKGFGRPVPGDVADALERRKAFEEQFSMTMRQLREELMGTSIKQLSGRSQTPQSVRALLALSDERISRIMEEAYQVPVEEKLHIETIRLFIQNCKHRLTINEYANSMLVNSMIKDGQPVNDGKILGLI